MNDAGQFYTNRVLKDFKEKCVNNLHLCCSIFNLNEGMKV